MSRRTRWSCGDGLPDSGASRSRRLTPSSCGHSRRGPTRERPAGRLHADSSGVRSPTGAVGCAIADGGRLRGLAPTRGTSILPRRRRTVAPGRQRRQADPGMQHGRKKQLAKALRQESNDAPPNDPGIASGRVAGFIGAARDALLEKYEHLSRKYEALVKKYETASAEQTGVYRLGWWALRTSASALALVGRRGLILSDSRWHALNHGGGERAGAMRGGDPPPRTFGRL